MAENPADTTANRLYRAAVAGCRCRARAPGSCSRAVLLDPLGLTLARPGGGGVGLRGRPDVGLPSSDPRRLPDRGRDRHGDR